MKISFVVPCYNEEGNVKNIYHALHEAFGDTKSLVECVMVDDGSRDGTLAALRSLVREAKDPLLKVVSFSRNFGKEAAILAGLRHAEGDFVCVIDADLQQDPKVAREMYEILFAHPLVEAVTGWDFTDGGWLGAPSGIVKKDGTPKPAYHELRKMFKEEWNTDYTVHTDSEGFAEVTGFKGDYEATFGAGTQKFTLG